MARPSLSLRIIPRFPAKVLPGDGIAIIRTGGSITIDMDWSNIAQASFPVDPSGLEFTLRQADGSFVRVPVEEIVLPQVTWDTLSGKPSEFPPSAHTHTIPNIVGLQSALDSKVDDTDVIDVAHGGSGRATATAYGVIIGGTTSTGAHQSVALGTAGQVLTSNGAGAAPTMQAPAATSVPNGTVIGSAIGTYTTNADITAVIPSDDTIPQNTEGTQIISVSYAPSSATSILRATFSTFGAHSATGNMSAALFVNSTANALAGAATTSPAANYLAPICFQHEWVPGSTSSQTINVRVGVSSGTMRLNGLTSGRLFGGVAKSVLIIEEIKA